ncbi:MAG TPA: DUF4384 domain-containing protein [Gemmatimonadales bacterium]|nr:DUF4384 domain-containing protein [Gemmatimonadales bacterium]
MISALIGVLIASTGSAVSPAVAPRTTVESDDPPVRISLNSSGEYYQGDRAKVRVRLAEDGYLLVLRADADGRVRVLFPLDPGDDDFVRGGHDFELRGRGDRESFFVDDVRGTGTILAARSSAPFRYDRFVRGDHWDYRVLASDRIRDDAEAGLLDLVDQMADSAHYDYDVTTYSVGRETYRPYYSSYDGYYGPGYYSSFSVGFAFGSPYYRRYCDPFLYDPFFCDSFYYDPFFYDPFSYGVIYRPYGYGYGCFGNPFCYGNRRVYYGGGRPFSGFTFKRPMPQPPLVLPRQRGPSFNTPVRFNDPPPVNSGIGGRGQPQVDPRRRPTSTTSPDHGSWRRDPPSTESRPRGGTYVGDDRGRREPPPAETRPRSNGGSASNGGDNGGRRRDPPPSEARPRSNGGSSSSNGDGGGRGGHSGGGWSSGGGGGRSAPSSSSGGSRPSNSGGGRRRP